MRSMQFLSISLLMACFGGSIVAFEQKKYESGYSEKIEIEKYRNLAKSNSNDGQEVSEENKKSKEDGMLSGMVWTVTIITTMQIGLCVRVVAVTGTAMAYKYHPAFNNIVNETASAVKDKVEDREKDGQNTALVVGGIATIAVLGGAYYYNVAGKICSALL